MTGVMAFAKGRYPELDQRLADTLVAANAAGSPWACRHVVLDGMQPLLCAQHPPVVLMCFRCSQRHAGRHDQTEELTCDVCRERVPRIDPVLMSACTPEVSLRDPKGWHRIYRGPISILGVGICPECRDRTIDGAA